MISKYYKISTLQLKNRTIFFRWAIIFSITTLIYTMLLPSRALFISALSELTIENITEQSIAPTFISVNNIDELRNGNYKVNEYVKTLGYYSPYDGGGNEFIIKEGNYVDNGGTIIQINDSTFAVSVDNSAPSFQQFGATGNGSSDDFNALNNAINSGASEFNAGSGTYNLNNKTIKLPKYMKIYGDANTRATIKNGCFNSPYGVSLSNLAFDGGAYNKVPVTGRSTFEGRFQSIVCPVASANVSYDNCVFSNSDYCSFGMVGPKQTNLRFLSDTVNNCTFTNVSRIAVYHCINSNKSTYTNNYFGNIGSSSITTGTIAALKLGDTTNISTLGVSDAYIYNNTFENLISGDDYSDQRHIIDCNFITVYGRKATIEQNTISNLIGYGNDREAVYTKVRYCSIIGNNITNGGFGEGYICNKGYSAEDSYTHINNNTISGTSGVAIQTYGASEISGNHINLTNCSAVISCYGHNYFDLNRLIINNNIIECCMDLAPNVTTSKTNVIRVEKPSYEVHFNGNQITCTSNGSRKLESIIKVGSIPKSVYVRNNTITSNINKCTGILLCSNESFESTNSKMNCDVSGNVVNVVGQPLSIAIRGNNSSSSRMFNINKNVLNDTSKTQGYATVLVTGTKNNDIVYYSNNTSNTTRDLYSTTKRSSVGKNTTMISGYKQ